MSNGAIKNNDNGQVISYIEGNNTMDYCYVRAGKRIRKRFVQLHQKHNLPSVIFLEDKKKQGIVY